MTAFYDQSKELEMTVSAGGRFQGTAEVAKVFRDAKSEVRFSDSKAQRIAARSLGETALVSFEHLFKIEVLEGGAHFQVHLRTTSTLRLLHGQWRIVMEHSSPIAGIERDTPIKK
jgi:ketosteroid isomerase-like protein